MWMRVHSGEKQGNHAYLFKNRCHNQIFLLLSSPCSSPAPKQTSVRISGEGSTYRILGNRWTKVAVLVISQGYVSNGMFLLISWIFTL